jgi:hypothetical protein
MRFTVSIGRLKIAATVRVDIPGILLGPSGLYLWLPLFGLGLTTAVKVGIQAVSSRIDAERRRRRIDFDTLNVSVDATVLGFVGTLGILVEGLKTLACGQVKCPISLGDAIFLLLFLLFAVVAMGFLIFYESLWGQPTRDANPEIKTARRGAWIKGFVLPFLVGLSTLLAVSAGANTLISHG